MRRSHYKKRKNINFVPGGGGGGGQWANLARKAVLIRLMQPLEMHLL